MYVQIVLISLCMLVVSGCATSHKKQTTQQPDYQGFSQTYQQNTFEDAQPAKTTVYSAPVNLSAKQIQKALKSAGFYQGAVDGKIGSKTREAIIKFQKAHNLKADGIVGKRTSVELNKYLSK